MIVFKTGEADLKLSLPYTEQAIPFVVYNNKTVFFLVVDIYPYEASASKRGVVRAVELNEADLVKVIG